ncbi:XdhC family protein [Desulfobaculum bizertense]|uniref:XdhC family aldehyde oxidoreductase maturation factor n=1 Tax=Desulfobaculum bizertense TaxID=376490 RepID=UPI001F168228|nr:XdhC/CoxI family protein [Desulfobaculum bizertense]UIJ38194.1 XdhC family protein [Desulfobaculum bizertense]
MIDLLRSTASSLHAGEDLILASILDSKGSTPRSAGSAMTIHRDGHITGTVGGGIVEEQVRRAGVKMFNAGKRAAQILEFDFSNSKAAISDMICGGWVSVLLEHIPAEAAEEQLIQDALTELRQGRPAILLDKLSADSSTNEHKGLLTADTLPDWAGLTAEQSAELTKSISEAIRPLVFSTESGSLVARCFHPLPSLFIFGGGHVSRPTAKLAASIGFRTVVMDDRKDFANRERFPEADEVLVLDAFKNAFEGLPVREDSFIVIVTRGHLHDKTVLAQALRTPAKYIGMIGSKKKRDAIYAALLKEGFTQADIDRCHCPIGLSIGAQTPEEIAVSINAELIADRAGVSL